MDINDFLSVDEILSDVLMNTNDEALRKGFSKGWYVSQIQQSIEEISLDSFYDIQTRDFDMDTVNLSLEMPKNAFNIREMYLHNGDCCEPDSFAIVHWKRLHNNKGRGAVSTGKQVEGGRAEIDPFFGGTFFVSRLGTTGSTSGSRTVRGENVRYANIYNGLIMFDPGAAEFTKVRLVYNGLGGELGDIPVIPRFFRQYCIGFVCEKFFGVRKVEVPGERIHWVDWSTKLNDPRNGLEIKALKRISSMNKWEKESLNEYLGRANY